MPGQTAYSQTKRWLALGLMFMLLIAITMPTQAAGNEGGTYTIKKGDTLYSIAKANAISIEELMLWNNIKDPTKLQIGNILRLTSPTATQPAVTEPTNVAVAASTVTTPQNASATTPATPATPATTSTTPATTATTPATTATTSTITPTMRQYTVQKNDTLWSIAKANGVTVQDIQTANGLRAETILQVGSVLKIPQAATNVSSNKNGVETPAIPSPQAPNMAASVLPLLPEVDRNNIEITWPVMGILTSAFGNRWGRMHEGIDLGVSTGTPVRAAAEGTVSFAAVCGAYGKLVIIDHGNGWETYYAHNSQIMVSVGDHVYQAQVIAKSGSSGRTTGPHLHFEVRRNGVPVDPMRYL